jgi:hypothetical protein
MMHYEPNLNGELDKDGKRIWTDSDGKLHRDCGGPAVEYADGTKHWYFNDKRHREDGAAVEFADGDKWWYINDKRHREDGPAKMWIKYNSNEWYLNDIELTKDEWLQWLKDGHSSLTTNEVTRLILEWS